MSLFKYSKENGDKFSDNSLIVDYVIKNPDVWNCRVGGDYGVFLVQEKINTINNFFKALEVDHSLLIDCLDTINFNKLYWEERNKFFKIFYKILEEDKDFCLEVLDKGYLEYFSSMEKNRKDIDVLNAAIDKFVEFDISKKYNIEEIVTSVSKLSDTFDTINFKKERRYLSDKIDLSQIRQINQSKESEIRQLNQSKESKDNNKDWDYIQSYKYHNKDFRTALKNDKVLCIKVLNQGLLEYFSSMGENRKDIDVLNAAIDKFVEFDISKKYNIEEIVTSVSKLSDTFDTIDFKKERKYLSDKIDLSQIRQVNQLKDNSIVLGE